MYAGCNILQQGCLDHFKLNKLNCKNLIQRTTRVVQPFLERIAWLPLQSSEESRRKMDLGQISVVECDLANPQPKYANVSFMAHSAKKRKKNEVCLSCKSLLKANSSGNNKTRCVITAWLTPCGCFILSKCQPSFKYRLCKLWILNFKMERNFSSIPCE